MPEAELKAPKICTSCTDFLTPPKQLIDPSERNARRVRDVISVLEEYGGMAG